MKPGTPCSMLVAAALAVCCLIGATALYAQGASQSIWDAVYTAAQAQRGAALYATHCTGCHLDNLAGDGAEIPPLAGKAFLNNWDGLALSELFDRIHTSMPQNNPGILKAQEVADLMAYLLSANQLPAGSNELPADTPGLQSIQFEAKRPSH